MATITNEHITEVPKALPDIPIHGETLTFLHPIALKLTKEGVTKVNFIEKMGKWFSEKGSVYLQKLEVKVRFTAGGGHVICAWVPERQAPKTDLEMMTYVNREDRGSTSMDYATEHAFMLAVPEGNATLIFPATADRPQTCFTIWNGSTVTTYVTLFLYLKPTGPIIQRWTMDEGTGDMTAIGGF